MRRIKIVTRSRSEIVLAQTAATPANSQTGVDGNIGWYSGWRDDPAPAIRKRPPANGFPGGYHVQNRRGITTADEPVLNQWFKHEGPIPDENQPLVSPPCPESENLVLFDSLPGPSPELLVEIQPLNPPDKPFTVGMKKYLWQSSWFDAIPRPRYPRPGFIWTPAERKAYDAAYARYERASCLLQWTLNSMQLIAHAETQPGNAWKCQAAQEQISEFMEELQRLWDAQGIEAPDPEKLREMAGLSSESELHA